MNISRNTSHWNLEDLKRQLSLHKEIKGWMISQEHLHRRERYFLSDKGTMATDQDRSIHAENLSLRIFVHLDRQGRQGEMTKKLTRTLTLPALNDQLKQMIHSALQTDHQAWELPVEPPKTLDTFLTTDPRMAEDLDKSMEAITGKIKASVEKSRATQFNSSELFLSVHHYDVHLSNGLHHRSSQSRAYTEAAFSFSHFKAGKLESDEYLNHQWAVHLDQLPIEKIFDEASHCAEHSLDVQKPVTGKYPVIINAEVLSTLLNGYLSHLSAQSSYHGLPFISVGSEFIPNSTGDRLSISLDPTLEFGADTTVVSSQGVLQHPLKLVDQNTVVATATDQQHGSYLNSKPTTTRGNLVLAPGMMSFDQLTQTAPQVLEILQFSGLFADPQSGTFSSEIRLARLYDNLKGTTHYIKGGSLSGSINENFRGIKLSNSQVSHSYFSSDSALGQGYYGPDYALLNDVSIVG